MVMAVQPLHNSLNDAPHLLHCPPPLDPNPLLIQYQYPNHHLFLPTANPLPTADLTSPPRKRPRVSDPLEIDAEVDALVGLQFEGLRAALEEQGRRQLRGTIAVALRLAQRRLGEKDAELEAARRRAAELESRAVQVAAEGQIWLHVARSSEALAASLRVAIERAEASVPLRDEGDEESCCDGAGGVLGEERMRKRKKKACKACGEGDVSVLVLPCRHLCLCCDCDRAVDRCPVCGNGKGRSLQVFLS